MRFFGLLALSLALPLAACMEYTTQQEAAYRQRIAASDDAICRSYGAKPGTDIYVQCRMAQAQQRATAEQAAYNTPPPSVDPYVPHSDAPILTNTTPQITRCQSVYAGLGTYQTRCF
jgi:hypothetical protein